MDTRLHVEPQADAAPTMTQDGASCLLTGLFIIGGGAYGIALLLATSITLAVTGIVVVVLLLARIPMWGSA